MFAFLKMVFAELSLFLFGCCNLLDCEVFMFMKAMDGLLTPDAVQVS